MSRLIFHVDVNSAFLSWEAARRVKEGGEDIRLTPSAIGGDREKRTGVILAKSIPAKKFGVKTGEPVGMALRKCPELFLARPDFRLYEENSRAFIAICREYAPVVEQVSIDECFLDMSGTERIYPDPYDIALTIKNTIRDRLGFTVNVGISINKLLAKMASDFEKPDKIHTLFPDELAQKMWPLPVGELYTVGSATAEKLRREYITTIGDLANADVNRLKAILGQKQGQHVHNYANGIDDSPVLAEPEEAKGYSNSTTTAKDVVSSDSAYKILLALADSVAARMRMDGAKAYCVSVTIRDNAFKTRSHQRSLKEATDVTNEIYALCRQLFDELWDK
ncbi:MAG: DNA polymerase IV, partial [Clostridia bacterium]|nr:DNA polymerase IV [Clostridia bacterium]